MTAYYNEIDAYAAQWLRNLITKNLIAPGDVDERDIRNVTANDLRGYKQHHFFAGIGGWSLALRLAGWPDDGPVWTGSCPCQPFSSAGQKKSFADERHLWPAWFNLIKQSAPPVIFGEQVAAAIRQGWLDAVYADLEGEGYACGAAVLPACGLGAPHIRQRLWLVCDDELGRAGTPGLSPRERQELSGPQQFNEGRAVEQPSHSPWSNLVWLPCTDGKARPAQSGIQPLAHGVPARVGKLRAAGNAIVPQVAAEFIKAYMQS